MVRRVGQRGQSKLTVNETGSSEVLGGHATNDTVSVCTGVRHQLDITKD